MKFNNKGFTLVEIMVTLVISSIIMLVAGTIILNSFGYFNSTETANVDKLAADNISTLVRDELAYASRVVIAEDKPEDSGDWYSLSINEEGHLLKTSYIGDKVTVDDLYQENYYHNRTIGLRARCYDNDYRMDIAFSFLDNDLKEVYKTSITLELINMKNKTSDSSVKTVAYSSASEISYDSNIKIFYQHGTYGFVNDPKKDDGTGTVASEINCKNATNDKGLWKSGVRYERGDFVYVVDKANPENKIWFRLTEESYATANSPDTKNVWQWKKIDKYLDTKPSRYMIGDIIIVNHLYYQALSETADSPLIAPSLWSKGYKKIGDLSASKGYIIPSYNKCSVETIGCTGTVSDKIFNKTTTNDKGVYEVNIIIPNVYVDPASSMKDKFKTGDFVKFNQYWETETKWSEGEWKWYMALTDNAGSYIPGNSKSSNSALYWQYIGPVESVGKGYKAEYDKNSSYLTKYYYSKLTGQFVGTGDIVFNSKDNQYYGAGGTSNAGLTTTNSDPALADWAQYWSVIPTEQMQKSIAECELKLKDSKE